MSTSLKRAASCVINPELSSGRRSSWTIDKNFSEFSPYPLKLKFSQAPKRSLSSLVPQIVFDSDALHCSNNCNTAIDLPIQCGTKAQQILSCSRKNLQERRASCGPILQVWRSSSPGKNEISLIGNEKCRHCKSCRRRASSPKLLQSRSQSAVCESEDDPLQQFLRVPPRCSERFSINQAYTRRNSAETISPISLLISPISQPGSFKNSTASSSHSWLRIPSLSPCFEDQPKQAFQFSPDAHNQNRKSSVERFTTLPSKQKKRRLSYQSPEPSRQQQFPHAGVFCPYSNFREKGIYSAPRPLPPRRTPTADSSNLSWFLPPDVHSVGRVLGRGGYGTVRVGTWKGQKVAVKTIKGRKISSVRHEINLLGVCPHPALVKTHEIYISDSQTGQFHSCESSPSVKESACRRMTFPSLLDLQRLRRVKQDSLLAFLEEGDKNYFEGKIALVISELCCVSLLKLINSTNHKWDLRDKIRILEQISSGLCHLHSLGIVHLDVKPSNCFFNVEGNAKLGDFGCSSQVGQTPDQVVGTVVYQAPEVLRGEVLCEKSDIYSLALTAWHLLTEEVPYRGLHPHVIIYKVTRLEFRPDQEGFANNLDNFRGKGGTSLLHCLLRKFIQKCWIQGPELRPSAAAVRRLLTALYFSPASD